MCNMTEILVLSLVSEKSYANRMSWKAHNAKLLVYTLFDKAVCHFVEHLLS